MSLALSDTAIQYCSFDINTAEMVPYLCYFSFISLVDFLLLIGDKTIA